MKCLLSVVPVVLVVSVVPESEFMILVQFFHILLKPRVGCLFKNFLEFEAEYVDCIGFPALICGA